MDNIEEWTNNLTKIKNCIDEDILEKYELIVKCDELIDKHLKLLNLRVKLKKEKQIDEQIKNI